MPDWTEELFGGELQTVQAPVMRPSPIDQDALRGGGARRQFPAAPAQTPSEASTSENGRVGAFARPQMAGPTDWASELLGGGEASDGAQASPRDRALGLAKGINSGSLYGKVRDAFVGKQDPAHVGLKSFDEEMQAENNTAALRQSRASNIFMPDDAAYGDIMKDALGDRFISKIKDANGYDIVVYKGTDGAEKKAYVNRPGLDSEDISRGVVGALPYIATGGPVGAAVKSAPWLLRAGAQGLTAMGTSILGDVGSMSMGSEQGVDVGKAALTGGLGVAGETLAVPIGAAWRKWVTVPGLYDKASGKLTEKGAAAARAAGYDPEEMAGKIGQEFAKIYAKTPEASKAAAQFTKSQGGIESTLGQRSKDAEQLLKEEGMRRGLYGESAKAEMRAFDARQAGQVKRGAIGSVEPLAGASPKMIAEEVKPGIATTLAPGRLPNEMNTTTLGEGARAGLVEAKETARQAERGAWDATKDILPKPQAMDMLPDALAGQIGARTIDKEVTPVAYRMAQELDRYMSGAPMQSDLKSLGKLSGVTTVDGMRQRLGQMIGGASTEADKAAARALYRGFDDWTEAAASAGHLTGSPEALAAFRTARNLTAEVKGMFSARDVSGRPTQSGRIVESVLEKADSPEQIINALFSVSPQARAARPGAVEALQRIKEALGKYGTNDAAQNAWNDLRAAYWMRLVQDGKARCSRPRSCSTISRTPSSRKRASLARSTPKMNSARSRGLPATSRRSATKTRTRAAVPMAWHRLPRSSYRRSSGRWGSTRCRRKWQCVRSAR